MATIGNRGGNIGDSISRDKQKEALNRAREIDDRRRNSDILRTLEAIEVDAEYHHRVNLITTMRNQAETVSYLNDIDRGVDRIGSILVRGQQMELRTKRDVNITGITSNTMDYFSAKMKVGTYNVRITNAALDIVDPLGEHMKSIYEHHHSQILKYHNEDMWYNARMIDMMSNSNGSGGRGIVLAVKNFFRMPIFNTLASIGRTMTGLTRRVLFGKEESSTQKIVKAITDQTQFLRTGTILADDGIWSRIMNKGILNAATTAIGRGAMGLVGVNRSKAQDAENRMSLGHDVTGGRMRLSSYLFGDKVDKKSRQGGIISNVQNAKENATIFVKGNVYLMVEGGDLVVDSKSLSDAINSLTAAIGKMSPLDLRRNEIELNPINSQSMMAPMLDELRLLRDTEKEQIKLASDFYGQSRINRAFDLLATDRKEAEFKEVQDKQADRDNGVRRILGKILKENKQTNRSMMMQLLVNIIKIPVMIGTALVNLGSSIISGLGSILSILLGTKLIGKLGRLMIGGPGMFGRASSKSSGRTVGGIFSGDGSKNRKGRTPLVRGLMKRLPIVGQSLSALSIGLPAIMNADNIEDRKDAIAETTSRFAGGLAGAKAGAVFGTKMGAMSGNPMIAGATGIVGGIIGGMLGSFATGSLAEKFTKTKNEALREGANIGDDVNTGLMAGLQRTVAENELSMVSVGESIATNFNRLIISPVKEVTDYLKTLNPDVMTPKSRINWDEINKQYDVHGGNRQDRGRITASGISTLTPELRQSVDNRMTPQRGNSMDALTAFIAENVFGVDVTKVLQEKQLAATEAIASGIRDLIGIQKENAPAEQPRARQENNQPNGYVDPVAGFDLFGGVRVR